MYFDSHAHLGEDCFAQDFVNIVEKMRAADVTGMMEIGCDGPSSHHAVELAHHYSPPPPPPPPPPAPSGGGGRGAGGNPPRPCHAPESQPPGIGLDYHYEDPPRDVQQRAFRMQMKLAQELSLPVVIHEREAHEDGLRIVSDFPDVTGVFHCFSGSYEMAKELVKARLVHRLYRRGHVQKRAQSGRGRGKDPAGPHPHRNGLSLYGPGSRSGAAATIRASCRSWQKDRGASRHFRRSCCRRNSRKRKTAVPDLTEAPVL